MDVLPSKRDVGCRAGSTCVEYPTGLVGGAPFRHLDVALAQSPLAAPLLAQANVASDGRFDGRDTSS